jgi:hypothetical protein
VLNSLVTPFWVSHWRQGSACSSSSARRFGLVGDGVVGAAFTLILLALFVLDFLELRGTVTVGARGGFDALG